MSQLLGTRNTRKVLAPCGLLNGGLIMSSLQDSLKSASLNLFQSYQKSLTLAMESWLPAIEVKNSSQNGYPHVKNIEKHLNTILFSSDNRNIHKFEMSAIELYILLMSVLLHDIGKQKELSVGSGQSHSFYTYDIITESWAELGVVSKQTADVIALICFSHDYKRGSERANDVEKRLTNFVKTEHDGIVRAKALASLLFLGDHMDGSLSRAVPHIVTKTSGIVGEFRGEVQSVYLDIEKKMLCTSINARLLADASDSNAKFFNECEYRDSENVKKDIRAFEEGRGLAVPVFDEDGDATLIKLINEENVGLKQLQSKIINTLICDVEKSNTEIGFVRNSLYEIGIPVLGWFIECSGMLFKAVRSEKNESEKYFRYYKAVPSIEPILTVGFLKTIFRGMVEISGSSLGESYYDYVALLNYSREPSFNMHKVKCAVNRLDILHSQYCTDPNIQVVFYHDANCWSLRIRGDDIQSQRKQLQDSFNTIFAAIPEEKELPESKSEKPVEPLNICGKIKYDTNNSIILSNSLDYLLCRDLQHHSHKTKKNLRISKYQIAKLLRYECGFESCIDKCDECAYIHSELDENESIYFLGGLLISNETNQSENNNNDVMKMLDVKRFEPGAGNIVIAGSYGTGKSTLSFQLASICANEINKGISVYYSLESTRHNIVENYVLKDIEAKEAIERKVIYLEWYPNNNEEDDNKDSASLSQRLRVSMADDSGTVPPRVLLPKLTPKSIVDASTFGSNDSGLFEKRFQELKHMLAAIDDYNSRRNEKDARVKMVVIDSLNAFADRPLLRGEVHRLFDLFTSYNMLGIFTMEESVQEDFVGANYNDSIQYRADGVILLRDSSFQSHHESYLEVRKMRNQQHVLGAHLYKIRSQEYDEKMGNIMNREIEIYPSLHYLISATEKLAAPNDLLPYNGALPLRNDRSECHNIFHLKSFDSILPENIINRSTGLKDNACKFPSSQVITITGPSGLYKSDLVINALFAGMIFGKENGLLIRLNDRDLFEEDGFRLSSDLFNSSAMKLTQDEGSTTKYFDLFRVSDNDETGRNTSVYKTRTKTWRIDHDSQSTLTELIFTSGALKPEEFIDTVLMVIQKNKIRRVALVDLKNIGISYPFLINSETSGKMFIPAFIHLMRNHKVHLLIATSTSHVEESASEINKACELSDALITVRQSHNDPGKTYVESSGNIVRGEKYCIEQERDLYYYCRIRNNDSDPFPSHTPKLSPFTLKPDVCDDPDES